MQHLTIIDLLAALVAAVAIAAAAHPDLAWDVLRFAGTAVGTFLGVYAYGVWRERRRQDASRSVR